MQEQDNPPEEWRPVPGWERIYSVSNLGRIRREVGVQGSWAGRILISHERNRTQVLEHGGRREQTSAIRLVEKAFPDDRPDEEWRPVVDYEGWYEVSNLGRVRGLRTNFGRARRRVLKCGKRKAYPTAWLSKDNTVQSHFVHRLVAAAFIGPRPPGEQVNHKDGVGTNNRPQNLEYVTASENQLHALGLGLARDHRDPVTGRFT